MIDLSLSLNEENVIADTSHDAEFTRKLFGDLNRDILGRLVTARSSSSTTPMKKRRRRMRRRSAPNSRLVLLLSTQCQLPLPLLSMPLRGQKIIIVMIRGPIRRLVVETTMEVATVRLRLPRRRPRCRGKHVSRTSMVLHCYFSISVVQRSWYGDVESSRHLESLTCPMHCLLFFSISVISLM
jgi:hypothetical protein